jgi:hypothetical protein
MADHHRTAAIAFEAICKDPTSVHSFVDQVNHHPLPPLIPHQQLMESFGHVPQKTILFNILLV